MPRLAGAGESGQGLRLATPGGRLARVNEPAAQDQEQPPEPQGPSIVVVPIDGTDQGACPDCGGLERTVWGHISRDGKALAVYYARWTIGHPERGAQLMVSLGGWSEGENEAGRKAFGVRCLVEERRPTFRLVDADEVAWAALPFLGDRLARAEALADPRVQEAFQTLERVVFDDPRVRRFLAHGGRDPKGAAALLQLAASRLDKGDDAGAELEAGRALGLDPQAAAPLFYRGWARGRGGDKAGAAADLEAYLQREPGGAHAARARKMLAAWSKG